jgi:hypothetical protein
MIVFQYILKTRKNGRFWGYPGGSVLARFWTSTTTEIIYHPKDGGHGSKSALTGTLLINVRNTKKRSLEKLGDLLSQRPRAF